MTCSLQQTYEAKRQEFLVELQKREDEMRQMFVQRVKEKEAELKDAEREVSGRDAVLTNGLISVMDPWKAPPPPLTRLCFVQLQSRFEQLKRLHADEKASLEEKKRLLEEDQSVFSKRRAAAQLLQAQSLTANGKKDKDRKK